MDPVIAIVIDSLSLSNFGSFFNSNIFGY